MSRPRPRRRPLPPNLPSLDQSHYRDRTWGQTFYPHGPHKADDVRYRRYAERGRLFPLYLERGKRPGDDKVPGLEKTGGKKRPKGSPIIKSITVRREPTLDFLYPHEYEIHEGDREYPRIGELLVIPNYNAPVHWSGPLLRGEDGGELMYRPVNWYKTSPPPNRRWIGPPRPKPVYDLFLGRIVGFGRDTRPTDTSMLLPSETDLPEYWIHGGRHIGADWEIRKKHEHVKSYGLDMDRHVPCEARQVQRSTSEERDPYFRVDNIRRMAPEQDHLKIYYEQNYLISEEGHLFLPEGTEVRVVPDIGKVQDNQNVVASVIASGRPEESTVPQLPYEAWRKILDYM